MNICVSYSDDNLFAKRLKLTGQSFGVALFLPIKTVKQLHMQAYILKIYQIHKHAKQQNNAEKLFRYTGKTYCRLKNSIFQPYGSNRLSKKANRRSNYFVVSTSSANS
jgi:hypothetical protein